MDERRVSEPATMKNNTTTDRRERELVVTRTFDGPPRIVFEAWIKPELFIRWWIPKSFGLTVISCEMDVRTGGSYRLVIGHPQSDQPMAFVGRYIDVQPPTRLVWTNEESDGGAVTTVTFEEKDGKTLLVLTDLYPSKDALDAAIASGSVSAYPEQFEHLDALLTESGAGRT